MPYTLVTRAPHAHSARCLFCGTETTNASGFCNACRRDGFHTVYFMTGRKSNGWEWRERNAQLLKRKTHRILVSAIYAKTYPRVGTDAPASGHPWRQYDNSGLEEAILENA